MKKFVIPFKPRTFQVELLNSLKRFNVFICHRRFGKTTFSLNILLRIALSKPNSFCAYIAPTFKWAKDVAWFPPDTSIRKFIEPFKDQCDVNKNEARITLPNGSLIRLFGSDDPDRLRGLGFDYIVIDEVSQMNPRTWTEILLPALSDKNGHAIFIGTPKGHNMLHDIWERAEDQPNWSRRMFKASETNIIDPDILEDLKKQMDEDTYMQEYECSFNAAIRGSYYGKLMNDAEVDGRIGNVPHFPEQLVYAVFDIGVDDSTAIWFYQKPKDGSIRIIDYFEDMGEGLPYYIKICRDMPYDIGMYYFPHDISVKEFGSGKTRMHTLKELDVKNYRVTPKLPINHGIDAVKLVLPRCYFDKAKCEFGIESLKQYKRDYDEKRQKFSNHPVHDWTSHAADAFRYLAVSFKERKQLRNNRPKRAKINYNPFESTEIYTKDRGFFRKREFRV